MSQSPSTGHSGPYGFTVRIPCRAFAAPVTDPYDRCFYAVCRALRGTSGCLPAMQAIVAAKQGNREARHG